MKYNHKGHKVGYTKGAKNKTLCSLWFFLVFFVVKKAPLNPPEGGTLAVAVKENGWEQCHKAIHTKGAKNKTLCSLWFFLVFFVAKTAPLNPPEGWTFAVVVKKRVCAKWRFYISLCLCAFGANFAKANNVQIFNVQVLDATHLAFDISWENSWSLPDTAPPGNHDAVWVFIKYQNNMAWQHLDVSATAIDYTLTGNTLSINPASDGKGFFIERADTGRGNIGPTHILVKYADSLNIMANSSFRVFGIEMVYVPQGGFYLGDGVANHVFSRGDKPAPFFINSENSIPVGKDSLSLLDTGMYAPVAAIPAAYPKGYNAFYSMKYEISQWQYVSFLNCLSFNQQETRTVVSPASASGTFAFSSSTASRNGIVIDIPGASGAAPAVYACDADNKTTYNDTGAGQARACNFLGWADIAAYLDWAALRPMTEMEFEKICRGPVYPIAGEFAWGTAFATDGNTIINDGTPEESVSEVPPAGYGLARYYSKTGPLGPMRCGFAGGTHRGRLPLGAAYFGVMEMSGNLWENCITVDTMGLSFTGNNGDGVLSATGDANVLNWPGISGIGAGYRGGAFESSITGTFRDLAVSDRFYAGLPPNLRRNTSGGRGVRNEK